MSEVSKQIVLSTPQTMRDRYPDAGWASINGSEAMLQYPEVILPPEITSIVREIVTKVEAAIRDGKARTKQPQNIKNLRSMSFEVPVEIAMDHLHGSRGKMQKPSRKEIIELYRRAGWDSVDIVNPTWMLRNEIRTITLRLTYWQTLPQEELRGNMETATKNVK